ncbi:hypothetical protein O4328_43680 [Rhodococcus opacus]|uniref:Uncharacterized protein n=1 Tax=Rhodococcus opacus TaxID=37919 RepID=A0AAX3YP70_RHOOP|nr:hypothetical protein [Rhodococcus opacus]MCZ4590443.1 hypothetical protein [Rhodococcus opacus]WLF51272.1 hypothetical protein Q5707_38570 [Rhodococcus opacus]
MFDLLEQTVRYLEALSDATAEAAPSPDCSFVAEFTEALRECAEAVKVAREDLIETGRPINPVYSHPGDGDTREELASRLAAHLFSASSAAER